MIRNFEDLKQVKQFKEKIMRNNSISQRDVVELESRVNSPVITSTYRLPRYTLSPSQVMYSETLKLLTDIIEQKDEETAGLLSSSSVLSAASENREKGFLLPPHIALFKFVKELSQNATTTFSRRYISPLDTYFRISDLETFVLSEDAKLGDLPLSLFLELVHRQCTSVDDTPGRLERASKIIKKPVDEHSLILDSRLNVINTPNHLLLVTEVILINFIMSMSTYKHASIKPDLKSLNNILGDDELSRELGELIDSDYKIFLERFYKKCFIDGQVEKVNDEFLLIKAKDITLRGIQILGYLSTLLLNLHIEPVSLQRIERGLVSAMTDNLSNQIDTTLTLPLDEFLTLFANEGLTVVDSYFLDSIFKIFSYFYRNNVDNSIQLARTRCESFTSFEIYQRITGERAK